MQAGGVHSLLMRIQAFSRQRPHTCAVPVYIEKLTDAVESLAMYTGTGCKLDIRPTIVSTALTFFVRSVLMTELLPTLG